MTSKLTISPIGIIRSCFTEKFGIPRQPGLVNEAQALIILLSPFDRPEMVKGLEQFSHIWVHFLFHQTLAEGWKATVRPPGLGGQQRVGVLASRSPHRPNHLGISAVQLRGIRCERGQIILDTTGGDFLDGTPVIDIKPYIPYCDSIDEASGGYSGRISQGLDVVFTAKALDFCSHYHKASGRNLEGLITQVLLQDPRPASQRRKKSIFGIQLWDVNIRWKVNEQQFIVFECEKV